MEKQRELAIKLIDEVKELPIGIQAEFISTLFIKYPKCINAFLDGWASCVDQLTDDECSDCLIWIENRTAA